MNLSSRTAKSSGSRPLPLSSQAATPITASAAAEILIKFFIVYCFFLLDKIQCLKKPDHAIPMESEGSGLYGDLRKRCEYSAFSTISGIGK